MAEYIDEEDNDNLSREDNELCYNILNKIYGNSLKAAAEFELEVCAFSVNFN